MNLKGTGLVPVFAIFCFFSLALGLNIEVEIVVPITKARTLPSASSDARGFVKKGQTFSVDGQSGQWYRISVYNSFVWIPKDAAKIIQSGAGSSSSTAKTAEGGQSPTRPQPGTAATEQPRGRTVPAVQPPVSRTGQLTSIAHKSSPTETTTTPAATGMVLPDPALAKKNTQPKAAPAPGNVRPPAAARPLQPPKPPASQTWFSKRAIFPQVPLDADGKEIMYFQVSNKKTAVFVSKTNTSTTLMQATKGDYFPLLEQNGLWCRIAVNDTSGWVELTGGAIVSAPKSGIADEFILVLIIAAVAMALTLVLIAIFTIRGRVKKKPDGKPRFHGLIIARSDPEIRETSTGKPILLEKHLASIGFSVVIVRKIDKAQAVIDRRRLDAVFIDWYIADDIPGTVEILFTTVEQKNLPLAIFFNVPKTTEIPMIPILLRAYHLGASFTDHEISSLLTPTMLSSAGNKGSAASALEGDIADGNLPEIMEFIEIGKKTGALAIETDSPIGVLFFIDGRIVHAPAANGIYGRDAISTLLNLKQGKFRFLLDKMPKIRDLNLSTLEVLMEWTKTKDETHRN